MCIHYCFSCDRCGGKGKIVKSTCPFCKGKKTSVDEDVFTVIVEKGMPDGHQIIFEQEADEQPETTPGDVVFKIKTLPHKRFVRKGDNLHLKMTISLLEVHFSATSSSYHQALVGFSKKIKHLDGHEVEVTRDVVTKPGEVIKIAGEGMPLHNYSSQAGDLIIEFSIRMPTELTEEQKEGNIRNSVSYAVQDSRNY